MKQEIRVCDITGETAASHHVILYNNTLYELDLNNEYSKQFAEIMDDWLGYALVVKRGVNALQLTKQPRKARVPESKSEESTPDRAELERKLEKAKEKLSHAYSNGASIRAVGQFERYVRQYQEALNAL